MSLIELEKHQETWRRNPVDFYAPSQFETKKETQDRLNKIKKNRKKYINKKSNSLLLKKKKYTWSNFFKKYIKNELFDDKLIQKEEDFIPYI